MLRLFPKTRAAWIRSAVIFACLVGVAIYRNVFSLTQLFTYQPREGDILFQSLPHGELVDAIEGIAESNRSHCGVLMRSGNTMQAFSIDPVTGTYEALTWTSNLPDWQRVAP